MSQTNNNNKSLKSIGIEPRDINSLLNNMHRIPFVNTFESSAAAANKAKQISKCGKTFEMFRVESRLSAVRCRHLYIMSKVNYGSYAFTRKTATECEWKQTQKVKDFVKTNFKKTMKLSTRSLSLSLSPFQTDEMIHE